ncbi:Cell cycle checkpoint control protein RAD9A-like protein [Drosera capensis]
MSGGGGEGSPQPLAAIEVTVSGGNLKTFARSINCLARIGNELSIQASPSQLIFCTLNSSRSAYQSITFKPDFFDIFSVSGTQVKCSMLLKAVCAVLRTPIAYIDHLRMQLADPDASKVQWSLECFNGMRKAYWITCNVDPEIQHLSLDKEKLPTKFVVRPRDLNRLLSTNFQSSLQEITIIATEHSSAPPDVAGEIGGKAVELRSYIDPTKENDSSLNTQLWIDPTEEFVQYIHSGNPVDVTFGMKELKAFISFCEACEVDIHLQFEKAGEPILLEPKFGLGDGSTSNFDVKLVLATMLTKQLQEGNANADTRTTATIHGQSDQGTGPEADREKSGVNASGNASNHTRIWSDLSGTGGNKASGSASANTQVDLDANVSPNQLRENLGTMRIPEAAPARDNLPTVTDAKDGQGMSQHHPSNWVEADEDDDDGDDAELCVPATPP